MLMYSDICSKALFVAVVAVSAFSPHVASAQDTFDFVKAADALGFGGAHHCEMQAAAGQPLVVRSTGDDPFFYSPPLKLRGVASGELVVRAAFEGPVARLGLYFATADSPNTGEDKVLSIPIRAGGKEREYRIPVGNHELWRGTITRIRFDLEPGNEPGAVMRLAHVAYVYTTELRIDSLQSGSSVLAPGDATTLSLVIANATPDAVTDALIQISCSSRERRGPTVREGASSATCIIPESARLDVGSLAAGTTKVLTATLRAVQPGVTVVEAALTRSGREIMRRRAAFCVAPNPPALPPDDRPAIRPRNAPWAIARNAEQAVLLGLDELSGLGEWWGKEGNRYVRLGRLFPIVSLLHGEREPRLEIPQWTSASESRSGGLVLTGRIGSKEQPVADVTVQFEPDRREPARMACRASLTARAPIQLRAFTAPRLLLGDGAFGADRDEGLLPGVEYLERGERSSSRLDYHTPAHLRTVPHPKKITYPLLAVTRGDRLMMLTWPFPRPDGDGLDAPAAGFASPNFIDGQPNHLMALFWPTVPGLVPENGWESRTPLEVKPGETIELAFELITKRAPGIHVADAIPLALRLSSGAGRPVVNAPPRDEEAERALCRVAYTDTVWHADTRGWNHAAPASDTQWPPHPYLFNVQFLEAETAGMADGRERDRIIAEIMRPAAEHRWEMGGKRPGGDDYYFAGDTLLGCIEAREAHARQLIRTQQPDGSWPFQPGSPERAALGEPGKPELGIVANNASPILAYALMTGDEQAEAAGRKALEHMKRYAVPRAAQVWEIPVHTPDIMGAARAATAYRLGYLLTHNDEYRRRVEYWLATGLPFVYFWSHPQVPYWHYATIPVFGATFFRAPDWIGLPVQWCGLVYAEEALRCLDLKVDATYETVGKGIVHSGMWQQAAEGKFRGLLPDSYPFAARQGNGPFINPETILRPWWLMRGYDFSVNSVVIARGADRSLRLSALGRIQSAECAPDGAVRAKLRIVKGAPCGVLIAGPKRAPASVTWRGNALEKIEPAGSLKRHESAWQYVPDRGWLLMNLIGSGEAEELVVR
jgi:hypothetical protein